MYRLKESIHIDAPIDRCFLLSTSIPLVARILGMTPVEGKQTGLVVDGDRVLWRGIKFGFPQFHETLITCYERPSFFQDSMASGRFKSFHHDHHFQVIAGHTHVYDVVRFSLPFGPLGKLVAKQIVIPHILRLLRERHRMIKRIAEGDDWKQYLEGTTVVTSGISR